ncbi:MAG TPA: CBS domain-containing protein [Thermomicrobiales bacterium]|nr:CBS domain-containing protein [Thermomicrobiales bacterium]
MLTEALRYEVVAPAGTRRKVHDLAIELGGGPTPPVTHLVLSESLRRRASLPWRAVVRIDRAAHTFVVAAGALDQAETVALPETAVLLRQDVLDALVVDIRQRRVTRANDLVLDAGDTSLDLCAIDVSAAAIVRRLTGGRIGATPSSPSWPWRDVEFLRGDPHAVLDGRHYNRRIGRLRSAEIARICENLPYLHATELLTLLPERLAADVLEALAPDRQLQVYDELEPRQQRRLPALMAPNAAADLVGRLEQEAATELLARLPAEAARRIAALLAYPADSAGGIMTNNEVTIRAGLRVGEARAALRDRIRTPDFVYFIYVIDGEPERRLRGVLTLRDLLASDAERRIDDLMTRDLITLRPLDKAEAAARRVLDSELLALPVTEEDGRLLGVVTVDAAIEQAAPARWRAEEPRLFA